MRLIKVIFVALFLLIILVPPAQAEVSLAISPMKFEYQLNPGDSVNRTITASNPGNTPLQVTTQVNDYKVTSQGVPFFTPSNEGTLSTGTWLKVEPTSFTLKPGETKSVTLSLKVPAKADPGGHYGAVLFQFGGASPQSGVGVSGRIAVVNLITLPGSTNKQGTVQQFAIPFFNSGYPVPLQITLGNTGNIHLPVAGAIDITNWFGQKITSLHFSEGFIFPNSHKTLKLSMNSGSMFGFYQAKLKLNDPTITNTAKPVYFIVFPWALVVGIILAAFGLYKLGAVKGQRKQKQ